MNLYFKNIPANIPQLVYTVRKLAETDEAINKLLDIIELQDQRISELSRIVYELAPEHEVIETLADTEEEKVELLGGYMNRNDNYLVDRGPKEAGR